MPIIQSLGRLRQEDCPKFEASFSYIPTNIPASQGYMESLVSKITKNICTWEKIDR